MLLFARYSQIIKIRIELQVGYSLLPSDATALRSHHFANIAVELFQIPKNFEKSGTTAGTKSPVSRFYVGVRHNRVWCGDWFLLPQFCGPLVRGAGLLTHLISRRLGDLDVPNSSLLRHYCPVATHFGNCLFVVKSSARSKRPFNLSTKRFKWEFREVSLKWP